MQARKGLLRRIYERMFFPRKFNLITEQLKELQRLVRKDRETEKREFEELKKRLSRLEKQVTEEFQRRDEWPKLQAELKREAASRQVWVIKCPAPDNETKMRWGDYAFARSLQKELQRLGLFVVIEHREDWSCEAWADVVLVLRGNRFYRPDRRSAKTVYVMWNISHPDLVTDYEYGLYDIVCVASEPYAAQLADRLGMPVYPLLQCTDTELFHPALEPPDKKWDAVFLGNSRGVARAPVMWSVQEGLPLSIWGAGWDKLLAGHSDLLQANMIENEKIPEIYRSARVVLNDHWQDMLDKQFINNRIFDVIACGTPVISDANDAIRALFPDAVLCYENKDEFLRCMEKIRSHANEIEAKVREQWPMIEAHYSFRARAGELAGMVEAYRQNQD